jgi:hypothetical protein
LSYATSLKFWGYGLLATIGFVGAWKWSEDFFNDVVNDLNESPWILFFRLMGHSYTGYFFKRYILERML